MVVIPDPALFIRNFEMICHLSGLDPARVVFVIGGKVYRWRTQ